MRPNTSKCAISKYLIACYFPLFGNAALKLLSHKHPSHIDKNMRQRIVPKFISLTMLWSAWTSFTSKCPSQWCRISNVLSFFYDCARFTPSIPCTIVKFISYKLLLCSSNKTTSPSRPLIIHSFTLNCNFNPFDKSLLTKSKFAHNNGHMEGILDMNFLDFASH